MYDDVTYGIPAEHVCGECGVDAGDEEEDQEGVHHRHYACLGFRV